MRHMTPPLDATLPMHIVVDSNVLLHCSTLETLNWAELVSQQPLVVTITPAVLREIDKLKQDGNTRRAKRARRVLPLVKHCELNDGEATLSPAVQLNIPFMLVPAWNNDLISGLSPIINRHQNAYK